MWAVQLAERSVPRNCRSRSRAIGNAVLDLRHRHQAFRHPLADTDTEHSSHSTEEKCGGNRWPSESWYPFALSLHTLWHKGTSSQGHKRTSSQDSWGDNSSAIKLSRPALPLTTSCGSATG